MLFTSFTYFAFLCIAIPLVHAARGAWRERWLLIASFVFYAAWDIRFVPALLGVGLFTYLAGRHIARARVAGSKRAALLALPVAVVLCVLAAFKYSGWIVDVWNGLLPSARVRLPSIILPLGISFYTFECISYLIDVYRGAPQLIPLRRFLLFPAFWPHLVAGPILRIKEFGPQLDALKRPSSDEMLAGIDRIAIGLFKKVALADNLAGHVDVAFANGAGNSSLDNWLGAAGFALQIYFDFSAYTDIAIGSSRMVGIKLPENFNLPYHLPTPSEFWNRWHMTLSRWIRDYLFFPLNLRAGSRVWLRYVYLVAVMTLVGLWHGAGLGFVLWGTWHGMLMVAHRVLQSATGGLSERWAYGANWLGRLLTLPLIVAAWVLFRAPTLSEAGAMLRSMLTLSSLRPAYSVNDYLLLLFCIAAYYLITPIEKRYVDRDPSTVDHRRWTFYLRPAIYAGTIQLLFMFDRSNVAFIYFQF
jgi:D-alanyl-lipoteichoic acid acyltransferase DltB (MBOAT superfamily)